MANVESLSKIGKKEFIRISWEFPASVFGQGASLAEFCQAHGYNPLELMKNLLEDQESLDEILRAANKVHKHRGKGPTQIKMEDLRGIISTDFNISEAMMGLSGAQILAIKSAARQRDQGTPQETSEVRRVAEEMIGYRVFY